MRDWLVQQRARLVAADPGRRRLRAAARVIGGVVIAFAVLVPTLLALGRSPVAVAPGVVVVLLSQLAVVEATRKAQVVTTLLLPVATAVSLLLASLLTDSPLFAELTFVGVLFVATYIRRFGARAAALGFAMFIAFFLALFLRVSPDQVPVFTVSAAIGALAGLLARFVLLPERAGVIHRTGVRALRARVSTMLKAMEDQLEQPGPRRSRRVHDELMRLNQTALAVESDIDALGKYPTEHADRLRRRVLDVELAAEHLATTLVRVADEAGSSAEAELVLAEFGAALRREPQRAGEIAHEAADRLEAAGSVAAPAGLRRLGTHVGDLIEASRALLGDVDVRADETDAGPEEEPTGEDEESTQETPDEQEEDVEEEERTTERDRGLRHTTRSAIQVACAGAAAIFIGGLVSDTRWYWAVITAFVVFAGTGSRGELLVKAWRRTVGTLFGVIAGVGVALLVSGSTILQVGVVLAALFLAFYLMSVSYALMTFFITVMLGVLYEILGRFSVHILEVRLVETAIGAAAGIVAALVLLPARTRSVVRDAADELLRGLRDLLRDAAEDLRSPVADEFRDLAPASRTVDERMHTLLSSASPLGSYRVGTSRASYERWRLLISSSAYYSRALAVTLPAAARRSENATRERLATHVGTLADLADALSEHDADRAGELIEQAAESDQELADLAESVSADESSLHDTLRPLTRLHGALTELATFAEPHRLRDTEQPA